MKINEIIVREGPLLDKLKQAFTGPDFKTRRADSIELVANATVNNWNALYGNLVNRNKGKDLDDNNYKLQLTNYIKQTLTRNQDIPQLAQVVDKMTDNRTNLAVLKDGFKAVITTASQFKPDVPPTEREEVVSIDTDGADLYLGGTKLDPNNPNDKIIIDKLQTAGAI